MSKTELLRDLTRDVEFLNRVAEGVSKKYAKKMKADNKACLLGITKYTNPTTHNTIWVAWYKTWNGYYNELCYSYLVEYLVDRSRNWVMGIDGSPDMNSPHREREAIVYTQHSLERLKERAGLDFKSFMAELVTTLARFKMTTYEYNGEESLGFALNDKGLFLTELCEWGVICKTFVSANLLGDEQQKSMESSIEGSNQYADYIYNRDYNQAGAAYGRLNRKQRRKMQKVTKVA